MGTVISSVISNLALAAVLGAIAWPLTRIWRSPQLAHTLWLLVLLKLITPPLAPVTIPWPTRDRATHRVAPPETPRVTPLGAQATGPAMASHVSDAAGASGPQDLDREARSIKGWSRSPTYEELDRSRTRRSTYLHSYGPTNEALDGRGASSPNYGASDARSDGPNYGAICALFWAATSVLSAGVLGYRCRAFRHILRTARDADGELMRTVERLAERLELKRVPRVQLIDAQLPPLVWSLGIRPCIILPTALFDELQPAQRDTVIAHELAHIKRRDHLVRWLEVFVLVSFWWYPVVWLARRKLHEAEEECCDAWVVWALPHERRSYGQAMLRTIEFLNDGGRVPALAGSALGRSFYQRRIHMILKQSINRRMSWTTCIGVSLLAAAVLPLAAQTAVPTADPAAAAPPIAPAQPATAPAPPAAAVPGAAQALPSADPLAAPGRAPTPASVPSPAADERVSREDLLARIEQLEQMIAVLTANRGLPQVGAPLSKAPPPTPPLAPVPHPTGDKVELELQGELAQLDVAAAEAELMSALQSVEHAEKLAGEERGLVPEAELDKLRHAARLKEIALRRARVKLQLFERQVQARRALVPEQFDGLKQQVQHVQDQMLHERAKLAELQSVGEALKAQQGAIHASKRHVADELARLKQMAKELPGDPGTRDAIYEFLTHYLKMSDEEAKAAVERLK